MSCPDCCIDWPCPDLTCLCLPAVQPEQVSAAIRAANLDLYEISNQRFPGCGCLVKLRPCVPCRCECVCQGSCNVDQIDLFPTVHHPVHEIVDIEINGVSQPLNGWRIDGKRRLVRPAGQGWPQQVLQKDDGDTCTWSVTVRYGTPPPLGLLRARDELVVEELARCNPSPLSACAPGQLVEVTDKSGTVRAKRHLRTEVLRRYGQRRRKAAHIDPLKHLTTTAAATIVVVDTFPPAEPVGDPDACAAEWAETIIEQPAPLGVDGFGLPAAG